MWEILKYLGEALQGLGPITLFSSSDTKQKPVDPINTTPSSIGDGTNSKMEKQQPITQPASTQSQATQAQAGQPNIKAKFEDGMFRGQIEKINKHFQAIFDPAPNPNPATPSPPKLLPQAAGRKFFSSFEGLSDIEGKPVLSPAEQKRILVIQTKLDNAIDLRIKTDPNEAKDFNDLKEKLHQASAEMITPEQKKTLQQQIDAAAAAEAVTKKFNDLAGKGSNAITADTETQNPSPAFNKFITDAKAIITDIKDSHDKKISFNLSDKTKFDITLSNTGTTTASFPSDPVEKQKAIDLLAETALKSAKEGATTFHTKGSPPENAKAIEKALIDKMEKMPEYANPKAKAETTINGKSLDEHLKERMTQEQDNTASVIRAPGK